MQASSFEEYRRLKRLKLAQEARFTIWERSPTPERETLLDEVQDARADEKPAESQPAGAGAVADMLHPDLAALDQEELKLFVEWLQVKRDAAAAEAERLRSEAEANRLVGPAPPKAAAAAAGGSNYGINLRPGEGERMAAFAKSGQRIPQRGEIGMTADQIEAFEKEGYVMSGSRHSRMNAIRMRKEHQVYTAEETAALAMFNAEEAKRKEQKLILEMKKLVEDAIGGDANGEDAETRAA